MIKDFHAKGFEFLSNFYPAEVDYRGEKYPTVEHAYQAAKTLILDDRERIQRAPTPGVAKRLGRYVIMRPRWTEIRISIMEHLLRQKFSIPELRMKLVSTGQEELVEDNNWKDDFWGVYQGAGQNNLGKLLMKIRQEAREHS